jgi:hypothetical protein
VFPLTEVDITAIVIDLAAIKIIGVAGICINRT